MLEIDEGLDECSIFSPSFRLRFRWLGDRWTHALEAGEPGCRSLLVEAFEEDPRDDPARVSSPTFQELRFTRDGESVHALLVGRCGRHHFAADFAARELELDGWRLTQLQIDLADRCRADVASLASSYRTRVPCSRLLQLSPHAVFWWSDTGQPKVALFSPPADPTASLAAPCPSMADSWIQLRDAAHRGALIAIEARVSSQRDTQRWAYSWTCFGTPETK
jgi:hypothetical protein